MPNEDATPFAIPSEMRNLAEHSVEQAKSAFNTFIAAAHDAVQSMEGQAKTVRAGAKDASERAMSYAERNVAGTGPCRSEPGRAAVRRGRLPRSLVQV